MNWGEISSTFHYWYYLDLLLDRRFIHILNSVVLKMAESLQDRPVFYNSTRGAIFALSHFSTKIRRIFDEISTDVHSTSCLSTKIRRTVAFDVMSDSTESRIRRKGFRRNVMDACKTSMCTYPTLVRATIPSTLRLPCRRTVKDGTFPSSCESSSSLVFSDSPESVTNNFRMEIGLQINRE